MDKSPPHGPPAQARSQGTRRTGLLLGAVAAWAMLSCGADTAGDLEPEPASPPPIYVNMVRPGISVEVEEGIVVFGNFDKQTKTVAVAHRVFGDSLYTSTLSAPTTVTPALQISAGPGGDIRALTVSTGPFGAARSVQQSAMKLVGSFYKAIWKATPGTLFNRNAEHIEILSTETRNVDVSDWYCSNLRRVVDEFNTQTVRTLVRNVKVELRDSSSPRNLHGEFFVCMKKAPKEIFPKATYGIKLAAFSAGAIARDFAGRTEDACGLLSAQAALLAATANGAPRRASFCHAEEEFAAGRACGPRAGGSYAQPSSPCFPRCLMGQLCYGLATDRFWYEREPQDAHEVLCADGDTECVRTTQESYVAADTRSYSRATADFSRDEQHAMGALLVVNRCAAWIRSLANNQVPVGCTGPSWAEDAMGAVPLAEFAQFAHVLPEGFHPGNTRENPNPSYTRKNHYIEEVCHVGNLLMGETMSANCDAVVGAGGLDITLGQSAVPVFRIGTDLAMSVESSSPLMYVAGGFRGRIGAKGGITYDAASFRASINFVRKQNGFPPE